MTAHTDWRSLHGDALAGRDVLVTGGAGFIGSHLAIALHTLGAKVTVLDDLSGGGNPRDLPAGIHFVHGSILDKTLLWKYTEEKSLVFHLAALGSVPRSFEQPQLYTDVNVHGTRNVLEAAKKAFCRRVIFAASSSVYGDSPALPKTESMPPHPKSPYAQTKHAGEQLIAEFADDLDGVSLRYFNIFGPRQRADTAYAAVIAAFARAILGGQRPVIYGDGSQSRDFTYVDNAVHANLLAAHTPKRLGGVPINIACGKAITVNELAQQMAKLLNRPEITPEYAPPRQGDVLHSLAALTHAWEVLNYAPIVDFPKGLSATATWYRTASS